MLGAYSTTNRRTFDELLKNGHRPFVEISSSCRRHFYRNASTSGCAPRNHEQMDHLITHPCAMPKQMFSMILCQTKIICFQKTRNGQRMTQHVEAQEEGQRRKWKPTPPPSPIATNTRQDPLGAFIKTNNHSFWLPGNRGNIDFPEVRNVFKTDIFFF